MSLLGLIVFLLLWKFTSAIPNFQIPTTVLLHLVKMAGHVWMVLEVTAVIVKQDILGTTVKQVRTTSQDNSCSLGMILSSVVISLVHECIT